MLFPVVSSLFCCALNPHPHPQSPDLGRTVVTKICTSSYTLSGPKTSIMPETRLLTYVHFETTTIGVPQSWEYTLSLEITEPSHTELHTYDKQACRPA